MPWERRWRICKPRRQHYTINLNDASASGLPAPEFSALPVNVGRAHAVLFQPCFSSIILIRFMAFLTLHALLPATPAKLMRLFTCLAGLLVAYNASGLRDIIPSILPAMGGAPRISLAAAPVSTPQQEEDIPQTPQEQPPLQHSENTSAGGGFNFEVLTLSEEKDFDFRRDWWKYSIMLVAVAIAGFYLIKAGTQLLRFLGLLLCLAFAGFLAYLLGPPCAPLLKEHLSFLDMPQCPILYWSYFLVFILSYIVATAILRLLRRPIDMKAPKSKSKS